MKIIDEIRCWGDPEEEVLGQMRAIMKHGAYYGALMADSHLGYSVPVGGVVAFDGKICVNGVGYDIACGNKAVMLDCQASDVRKDIYRTMNEVKKHISFGVGRRNNEKVDHELFEDPLWEHMELLRNLKDKAHTQLGTVGSGNHYVDIFTDELDRVWIGVHFGSRGLGHTIATHFVNAGGGKDGVHAEPVLFDEDSDLGSQYLKCMELAGRYAYAGRDWVCKRVREILRANSVYEVHNHHNFAWKEKHRGRDLWVVRKGATPAFPGQKGFIGGSMGDLSYVIEGISGAESEAALFSTVHGAGRLLGRTQAKGKWDKKSGVQIKPGLVDQGKHDEWMKAAGVEVRGGGLDESPYAYKRIHEVLGHHKNTIKILHTLTPIGVAMADERDGYDPYKD